MRTLNINNLRCNIGQRKPGVEQGGNYLLKLYDTSINSSKYKITTFDFNQYNDYAHAYEHILSSKDLCINLGGDHSVGAITVQSQLDICKDDLLVIWIDAHADINTWETSLTKNIHGMPVAPLVGLMDHWWNSPYSHHKLKPENLLYVGIRDLDPAEVDFINQLKIPNFPTYSKSVDEWIKSHPAEKIHISLDIDGLDPESMPSTGTTAPNGLGVEDVIQIINISKDKLVSFDLVEFNPLIGSDSEVKNTLDNCKYILDYVISSINKIN
jgi:arginase